MTPDPSAGPAAIPSPPTPFIDAPVPTAPRERAVRRTFTASILAKTFSVLCTLAQVPLVVHRLGSAGYGLWVTLISVTVLLNAIDFGLGLGMQQLMADAFARAQPEQVRRAFLSGCRALALLGLVALALGLPLLFLYNFSAILKITEPEIRAQLRPALEITLVAAALGLPLNALPRLAAAVQRGWIHAGWIAAGSGATLGALAWAAHAGAGLLVFVAIATLMPLVQGVGLWIHLTRALHWPTRSPGAPLPPLEPRALWGTSLLYTPTQLGLALMQAIPPLSLSVAAGPVAVTGYNLLQRLYSPVLQGQMMLLTPLLPVYTEAHRRGDGAWLHGAAVRIWFFTLLLGVALALVTWQSPLLIAWWVGPSAVVPSSALRWLICSWGLLQLVVLVPTYFLLGVAELRLVAWYSGLGQGLSVAGWFVGGARGGAVGAVLGGCCGLAIGGLPGLLRAMRRTVAALPQLAAS